MINKKVLVVAPYPIKDPHHGGQKRTKALVEFYKTIFSEVKFVGVFHRAHYPEYAKTDLLIGDPEIIALLEDNLYARELIAGKAIDNDIHVRSYMAKILMEFQPDMIHIEQPYPYLGLGPLLKELQIKAKVVFGSQNIEYHMKKKIFENLAVPDEVTKPIMDQMKQLEQSFSKEADLVIAVSKEDAAGHKAMGAKRVVIAPNGIEKMKVTKAAVKYWKDYKTTHKVTTAVTFIGSGHPPNWVGFLDMIGLDSSFMPRGAKILIGGGVADYFRSTYPKATHKKFWSRLLPQGRLSEERLTGLLRETDIIILPIVSGGGSNLKTAEAILSGKKIVASPYAFRGFERYSKLPNITIATDRAAFHAAIIQATKRPLIKRSSEETILAEQVQWKYCLRPIEKHLRPVLKIGIHHSIARVAKKPAQLAHRGAKRVLRNIR